MLIKLYKSQRIRVINSKVLFEVLRDIHFSKHPFEQEKEIFYTAILNRRNTIQYIDETSVGILTGTLVAPREVFRFAILKGGSSIAVCHNHPSGNAYPSDTDREVMKQLVQAGKIIGIPIMDSLIISDKNYYSFMDEGEL